MTMSPFLALKALYPDADPFRDWVLLDSGDGVRLADFDEAKLGPAPTIEQVLAYEPPITRGDVNAEAERRLRLGCPIILGERGFRIDIADDRSRANIAALKQIADEVPDRFPIPFTDFANVSQSLTAQEMRDMAIQAGLFVLAMHGAATLLKTADPIRADYASDGHWPGGA